MKLNILKDSGACNFFFYTQRAVTSEEKFKGPMRARVAIEERRG